MNPVPTWVITDVDSTGPWDHWFPVLPGWFGSDAHCGSTAQRYRHTALRSAQTDDYAVPHCWRQNAHELQDDSGGVNDTTRAAPLYPPTGYHNYLPGHHCNPPPATPAPPPRLHRLLPYLPPCVYCYTAPCPFPRHYTPAFYTPHTLPTCHCHYACLHLPLLPASTLCLYIYTPAAAFPCMAWVLYTQPADVYAGFVPGRTVISRRSTRSTHYPTLPGNTTILRL